MKVIKGSDKIGNFYRKGNGKKFYYVDKDDASETTAKTNAENYEVVPITSDIKLSDLSSDRNVFLFGEFNHETSQKLVKELMALDKKGSSDVNLFINSNGGYVKDLDAILDVMNTMESKVNTICLGIGASCGAFLLAMGTGSRFIGKNSRTMVHKPIGGAFGDVDSLEEGAGAVRELSNRIMDSLSMKTGQDRASLEKLLYKRDVYLSSDESVAFGLVDAVLLNTEEFVKDIGVKSVAFDSETGIDGIIFSELKEKYSVNKETNKLEGDTSNMITMVEAKDALKNHYNIDVDGIKAEAQAMALQVTEAKAELVNVRAELEASKADMTKLQAEVESDKKAKILEKMVADGKASQTDVEAYKVPFSHMSVEECQKMADSLTAKVNMDRMSSGGELPEEMQSGNGASDAMSADARIEKYIAEQAKLGNIVDYCQAAMIVE